jgi:hypothetical protein
MHADPARASLPILASWEVRGNVQHVRSRSRRIPPAPPGGVVNQSDTSTDSSSLIDAVEQLLEDYRGALGASEVLTAVARAQVHVRDGLGGIGLERPPDDEYAVLVTGLARQELAVRLHAVTTVRPPQRL